MIKLIKTFIKWIFSLERWKKRIILIAFDVIIVPISILLAFSMRYETTTFLYQIDTYISIVIVTIAAFSLYMFRGLYNVFVRHISIDAVLIIVLGSVVSSATFLFSIIFLDFQISYSVPLIYASILCVITTGIRFCIRSLGQVITQKHRKNVSIYGAGTTGVQLLNALKWNPNYRVCQFIDDNP
jgi:FlaA1/EpsC-like NDP-sugar epimerase